MEVHWSGALVSMSPLATDCPGIIVRGSGRSSRSWGWEIQVVKSRKGWVVSLKMVG